MRDKRSLSRRSTDQRDLQIDRDLMSGRTGGRQLALQKSPETNTYSPRRLYNQRGKPEFHPVGRKSNRVNPVGGQRTPKIAVNPIKKEVVLPGKTLVRTDLKPIEQDVILVDSKTASKPVVSPRRSNDQRGKRETKTNVQRIQRIGEGEINPAFMVLKPLSETMKKALSEKGEQVPNRLDVLAQQFYNKIVRKNAANNFTGQNTLPEIYLFDYASDHADAASNAVVNSIMNYYSMVRQKAENNQPLTAIEQIIAGGINQVQKSTGLNKSTLMFIAIAVAFFAVLLLVIKRK